MRISSVLVLHYVMKLVFSLNPYQVLGISSQADITSIKRAYKRMAKEWHPDKNSSPEAENKFVEINKAYELLSDPERRRNYDRFGVVEDTPNFRQQRRADSPFGRLDPDDLFSSFGSGGQFRFSFRTHGTTLFHKQAITLRHYENKVVPDSRTSPTLLLAFSEWCFACVQMEPIWASLSEELQAVGIRVATVHAEQERDLARRLSVDTLPRVYLILDTRVKIYPRDEFSFSAVVDFVKSKMSSGLFTRLDADNVDPFLAGWGDNRVRLVVYSRMETVRLRYISLAYRYRQYAASGYVQISADPPPATRELLARFSVSPQAETLHVFKEWAQTPAAGLTMDLLPFNTMVDVVEKNKFLILPRLSSQVMLDTLCPAEPARSRRHLCAVLLARSPGGQQPEMALLRSHIARTKLSNRRVRYAYIYADKQANFVEALTRRDAPADPLGRLVILWRLDHARVKYDWLSDRWDAASERVNRSSRELEEKLRYLLTSNDLMPYEATVQINMCLMEEKISK